ncbi:MAG: DmsE family decaheme c-type cytochrome [Betaproteobacteria bacterium]
MKRIQRLLVSSMLVGLVWAGVANAAEPPKADAPKAEAAKPAPKAAAKDLFMNGDAKCTKCHDEADAPGLLAIGKTRHGNQADSRTPTCVTCHGESDAHVANSQNTKVRPPPDRTFSGNLKPSSLPADKVDRYFGIQGKGTENLVDYRNEACLSCHRKDAKRSHWEGSTHQTRGVACTSCHSVHTAHDKVRDKRTQPEVCFTCHKEQRAQVNKPSHHPILEGKVACSDCHNSHGGVGPKMMKRDSVVETCYTCHMEKRGPFVHNHEPVNEDCSNCHNPHGTTAESLLKMRPPFLCHQCHTPHGGNVAQLRGQGQSAALLSATTGGKSGINYTQGRGCLNCHTQVHGSNNPSATNPTPQFNLR